MVKTTRPQVLLHSSQGLRLFSEPVWKFLFSACGAGVSIKPGAFSPRGWCEMKRKLVKRATANALSPVPQASLCLAHSLGFRLTPSPQALRHHPHSRVRDQSFYTGSQRFEMTKQITTAFLFCLLAVAAAAQSKDFWLAKDYKQWSEKECRKLLEDSPWASDYTLKQSRIDSLQGGSIETRAAQNRVVGYRVHFRSAMPIRQAMARQQMLVGKYDQLSPEQKQSFDERIGKFLSTSFADSVLAHVTYNSNAPDLDREMARYWQTQTTDTLKNMTFLIGSGGQRVPLQRFIAATGAGREFQMAFPRQLNGQPIVSEKDKTIKIEFLHPKLNNEPETRVLLNFQLEKMTANGSLVF